MVPKYNGEWHICIDYTDLNKPIPKKLFLDAYKGYHQIRMALKDMEKIAFVTDDGIFGYTHIPLGLKNTQAEFQQLVNNVFGDQIGWNMEVYMNDIILKSKKVEMVPQDMRETFEKI